MQYSGRKAKRRNASAVTSIIVKLPENLRAQLKTPLGTLLREKDATKENLLALIPKNSFVITVGDATTEKLLKFGITPTLQIVDGLEKRSTRTPPQTDSKQLTCDNPAGEITEDSIYAIKQAFMLKSPVQILVNGEEDLLVIPVCINAPDNSVVLYGQPNEGLVIVRITREIRNKTQTLLSLME
jgi:uncharacterized protein (UPF0218 family)